MKETVLDKLGFLVRFWQLKGRHATLNAPLSASEQVELLSLMQLVTGDFKVPPPGPCARPSNPIPAQLIGEGTILAVEIRHVGAAALVVASVKPMSIGERAMIRVADAISGVEYVLPCTLAWVHSSSRTAIPTIMALVVDGIPTRAEWLAAPRPAGRDLQVFPIGRQERLVS